MEMRNPIAVINIKKKVIHMNEPLVFMFSGQGSQYYHMGKELFKENTVFRQSMLEMDAIAARRIGTSIVEEIYHPGKRVSDPFDSILFPTPPFL